MKTTRKHGSIRAEGTDEKDDKAADWKCAGCSTKLGKDGAAPVCPPCAGEDDEDDDEDEKDDAGAYRDGKPNDDGDKKQPWMDDDSTSPACAKCKGLIPGGVGGRAFCEACADPKTTDAAAEARRRFNVACVSDIRPPREIKSRRAHR